MSGAYLEAGAALSEDGRYRYELTRRWHPTNPTMAVIMLNPSTADGHEDDPTIRRCVGFAKGFGCGALVVVNLYGLRATTPSVLWAVDDPVGPDNDGYIAGAMAGAAVAVAAWGASGERERVERVLELTAGTQLWSWGSNKDGSPKHPLYLPAVTALDRWPTG
jgi:hypothetical protein